MSQVDARADEKQESTLPGLRFYMLVSLLHAYINYRVNHYTLRCAEASPKYPHERTVPTQVWSHHHDSCRLTIAAKRPLQQGSQAVADLGFPKGWFFIITKARLSAPRRNGPRPLPVLQTAITRSINKKWRAWRCECCFSYFFLPSMVNIQLQAGIYMCRIRVWVKHTL